MFQLCSRIQNVLRMFQLCGVWAGRSRVIRGARWSARTKPTTEHQHIELSTTSRDSFHNILKGALTRQDTYAELAIKHGEPAWKWDGCLYLKSKVKPWWVALRILVIWQPNCLFPKFRENSLTAVISTAAGVRWAERTIRPNYAAIMLQPASIFRLNSSDAITAHLIDCK